MMIVSSLRHSSLIRILRASASASMTLAFFFSSVAVCGEALVFCVEAFALDLVVLKFAGVVRPVALVLGAPLEVIPKGFLNPASDISISAV